MANDNKKPDSTTPQLPFIMEQTMRILLDEFVRANANDRDAALAILFNSCSGSGIVSHGNFAVIHHLLKSGMDDDKVLRFATIGAVMDYMAETGNKSISSVCADGKEYELKLILKH